MKKQLQSRGIIVITDGSESDDNQVNYVKAPSIKDSACANVIEGNLKSENPHSKVVKKTNPCSFCDFSSDEIVVLMKHYKELHDVNYCLLCEMKCISQSHLNVHIAAAHPTLLSEQCTQSVAELKSLMCYTFSSSTKLFVCKFCDKVANKLCHMIMHIRVHTGERPYACPQCDYKGQSLGSLKTHKLYSHSNLPISTLRPFQCDECSKSFRSKSSLIKHKLVHSDHKEWSCESCIYSSRTWLQLREHKLDKHSAISEDLLKPYECEECGFRFKYPGHLIRHKKIHSKDKIKLYLLKCEYCDAQFIEKYNLTAHIRNKHNIGDSVRKFKCTECEKDFQRMGDLKKHAVIHQPNAVVHNCPHCDFKSKHTKSVSRHIKSKHLEPEKDLKTFICEICQKGFESNLKLVRHSYIHKKKSARPLSCQKCNFKAIENSALKRHMHVLHKPINIIKDSSLTSE